MVTRTPVVHNAVSNTHEPLAAGDTLDLTPAQVTALAGLLGLPSVSAVASGSQGLVALPLGATIPAPQPAGSPLTVVLNNPSPTKNMNYHYVFSGREVYAASTAPFSVAVTQELLVNGSAQPISGGEVLIELVDSTGSGVRGAMNTNTQGFNGVGVLPPGGSVTVTAQNKINTLGYPTPNAAYFIETAALSIMGVSQ